MGLPLNVSGLFAVVFSKMRLEGPMSAIATASDKDTVNEIGMDAVLPDTVAPPAGRLSLSRSGTLRQSLKNLPHDPPHRQQIRDIMCVTKGVVKKWRATLGGRKLCVHIQTCSERGAILTKEWKVPLRHCQIKPRIHMLTKKE